jgi:hypothetical protein
MSTAIAAPLEAQSSRTAKTLFMMFPVTTAVLHSRYSARAPESFTSSA